MSAPMKAETKAKDGTKRLSLAKRTLKDLSVRQAGPKGGFIMRDTIIIRTSGRA